MAGLYVHIPFCRHKCAYCDFYSGPLRGFAPQEYAAALSRELEARTLAPVVVVVVVCACFPSFDFSGLKLFIPCVFMAVVNLFKLEFSF